MSDAKGTQREGQKMNHKGHKEHEEHEEEHEGDFWVAGVSGDDFSPSKFRFLEFGGNKRG